MRSCARTLQGCTASAHLVCHLCTSCLARPLLASLSADVQAHVLALTASYERCTAGAEGASEDSSYAQLCTHVAGLHSGAHAPQQDSLLTVLKGLLDYAFGVSFHTGLRQCKAEVCCSEPPHTNPLCILLNEVMERNGLSRARSRCALAKLSQRGGNAIRISQLKRAL